MLAIIGTLAGAMLGFILSGIAIRVAIVKDNRGRRG
jgi:hypothetical protein